MNPEARGARAVLFIAGLGGALALAACTAQQTQGDGNVAAGSPQAASSGVVPGALAREGGSIATMADQYSHPRLGSVAAAGASAWVAPAPPPAYVATGPMPAAEAPEPPLPAAVANRQPSAPTAGANAAELVRPEAAAPDVPAAAAPTQNPAVRAAGLQLFNDYSCSACHSLADANATGSIGPSLDRNPRLAKAYIVDILTNGRGAMPAFGGQMSDAELGTLADYIVQFSRK